MSAKKYTEIQKVKAWNNYCETNGRLDDRIYKGLDNMDSKMKMCLTLLHKTETIDTFMRTYGGAK